jgi:hypothetical protein
MWRLSEAIRTSQLMAHGSRIRLYSFGSATATLTAQHVGVVYVTLAQMDHARGAADQAVERPYGITVRGYLLANFNDTQPATIPCCDERSCMALPFATT